MSQQLPNNEPVSQQSSFYGVVFVAIWVLVAGIVAAAQVLEGDSLALLIEEGGVVETLSAVGYLVCVGLLAVKGGGACLKKYWYFVVTLLVFAAREFDFDKKFTPVGIFKSKFLVSPEVGLATKIIGAAVLLFLVFTVVTILRRHAGTFLRSLKTLTLFEASISAAGASLVIAKSLDGLARKLRGIYEVTPEIDAVARNFEEALELGAPCFFALAILVYFGRLKRE